MIVKDVKIIRLQFTSEHDSKRCENYPFTVYERAVLQRSPATDHSGNSIHLCFLFFFKVAISSLFLFIFRLFNTVDNKQMFNKILPTTGVEPRISGIKSDCSTN